MARDAPYASIFIVAMLLIGDLAWVFRSQIRATSCCLIRHITTDKSMVASPPSSRYDDIIYQWRYSKRLWPMIWTTHSTAELHIMIYHDAAFSISNSTPHMLLLSNQIYEYMALLHHPIIQHVNSNITIVQWLLLSTRYYTDCMCIRVPAPVWCRFSILWHNYLLTHNATINHKHQHRVASIEPIHFPMVIGAASTCISVEGLCSFILCWRDKN